MVVLIVAPVGVYLTPTSFSFSAAGTPLLTIPGCAPILGAGLTVGLLITSGARVTGFGAGLGAGFGAGLGAAG